MKFDGAPPLIGLDTAKRFLTGMSPDLVWLLRQIETDDGFFRSGSVLLRR
jgi:hypothetical protein